jgi:hypothetical protein
MKVLLCLSLSNAARDSGKCSPAQYASAQADQCVHAGFMMTCNSGHATAKAMLLETVAHAALHNMHLLKLMTGCKQESMPCHGVGPQPLTEF